MSLELLFDQTKVPRSVGRGEWRKIHRWCRETRKRLAVERDRRVALVRFGAFLSDHRRNEILDQHQTAAVARSLSVTITALQVALLEMAYRDGRTYRATKVATGVSLGTINRRFMQFRRAGIPRVKKSRRPPRRFKGCPIYAGPDWIGKAAR